MLADKLTNIYILMTNKERIAVVPGFSLTRIEKSAVA
jgi:hypothetical protein